MSETKKLYDLDGYAAEFEAVVISCGEKNGSDKLYELVLDQTLFFPEEGGQSPDKGTIDDIKVLDVQIKSGVIYHTVSEAMDAGKTVHGRIDWQHRFSNMQQHSGEHIFSGLVHGSYGYDNVGFHLSDQTVTMDFNGVLTLEQAEEIEQRANEVIMSNLSIQATFPSKEELAALDYRSKKEIEGQIRIITIPGVDVCACCAPHVKATGEIGLLKIMNLQNYKGGVRISILCGYRAMQDFRQKNALIAELSSMLSANQETLVGAVKKLQESNQSLKYDLVQAKQNRLKERMLMIPAEQENVVLFEDGIDAMIMRNAVNELTQRHTGYCSVFAGNDADGYQFIIGSSSKDARDIMAKLKENFNARGGGSAAMVQGSVTATAEQLRSIAEA